MRSSAVLAALVALTGCGGAPLRGPLSSREVLTGGARETDALPLVVALHGRGGDPARFRQAFHGFAVPARIALLQAPIVEAPGYAWFTFAPFVDTDAQIRPLMPRIAASVAALVAAHPPRGRPIVTGFSQGAVLIYPFLARYPRTFAGAVLVSGGLWPELLPARFDGAGLPAIHALHGDEDKVIPVADDVEAIRAMRAHGARADLEIVPGGHHWIGGELRVRYQARLAAMIAAAQTD